MRKPKLLCSATLEAQPEAATGRTIEAVSSTDVATLETITPLETAAEPLKVERLNETMISVTSLVAAEQEQTEQKPAQADYSPASDREVVSKLSRSISLPPSEIQAVPEATLAARSNLGTAVSAHVFAHELDRSSTLALPTEFDAGAFTEKEGLSAKMNFGAIGQPTLITNAINAPIQAEAAAGSEAQSLIEQTAQPVIETAPRTEAGETRSLRLELNPIELGRVEVEITRDAEGRVSASLTAEQTETAQTLMHNLGHLRETLERAGLVIEQLQVTTAPPLQTQTSQQFGQQPNPQQTSPNHHHNRASFGSEQMVGEDTTPASDNRLLSMRA